MLPSCSTLAAISSFERGARRSCPLPLLFMAYGNANRPSAGCNCVRFGCTLLAERLCPRSVEGGRRSAMNDRPRDNDNDLIDERTELPTPGQGNASGGDLAREIGQRDELQSAEGEDSS